MDIAIDDDDDDDGDDGDEHAPIAEVATKATGLPKRVKEYIRKALRPNVHVGIYYDGIYQEYGPPGLLNVLAEEKYHKRLKKTVETTNGRDVEKFILQYERIVHTIRFVILNAFALSDPTLTRQINDLTKQIPSIFEKLLYCEEQIRIGLMDNADDDEFDIDYSADDTHRRPAVSGKLKVTTMRNIRHRIAAGINRDIGEPYYLPLTLKQMPDVFRRALSQAYDINYSIQYMVFGLGIIQYNSRVSFSDETFKRHTFNIGDHVRYREADDFGRIDHILVHEQARMNERRIFLVLTKVIPAPAGQTITYLRVLMIEDTHESIIIGLPALQTDRVYIVDISKLKDRNKRGH
ncbi:hypothetical protein QBC45DRAFT_386959 [Copromyces sp. CBS 386.78]|nr:hypothetical protein QBC45DRAFT_386959 [Copromyces sp. CBS 386.78]